MCCGTGLVGAIPAAHCLPTALYLPPPTTKQGGGVSHMVRFAGNLHARRHAFWLDVPAGRTLSVALFVKHVEESDAAAAALLAQLPDWASPAAVVSYQSRWTL